MLEAILRAVAFALLAAAAAALSVAAAALKGCRRYHTVPPVTTEAQGAMNTEPLEKREELQDLIKEVRDCLNSQPQPDTTVREHNTQ